MVQRQNTRIFGRREGFSLVEVVMAIGVVSAVILPCVGLNAVSLATLRSARSAEAASRIFRSVLSEASATEYASLPQMAGTRHFDFEGIPSDSTGAGAAVYRAEIGTFPATVKNSVDAIPLGDATGVTVRIYSGGETNAMNLISQRSSLFGNRAKGAAN